MQTHFSTPIFHNSDVVVRVATSADEVQHANKLVFQNYVQDGFWENDERQLHTNKFLSTPEREVFIALEGEHLVGTISIIKDSSMGLPSDGTQSALMQKLRAAGDKLAEVSAFSMDRSRTAHRRLACLLMSYMYQYSFYHAGIDRFVVSCKPAHANFYESVLCFSKLSDLTYYQHSQTSGYLLTLNLLEAHRLFSIKYPLGSATRKNPYRFYLCDPQPGHRFPRGALARPRTVDWLKQSMRKAA